MGKQGINTARVKGLTGMPALEMFINFTFKPVHPGKIQLLSHILLQIGTVLPNHSGNCLGTSKYASAEVLVQTVKPFSPYTFLTSCYLTYSPMSPC